MNTFIKSLIGVGLMSAVLIPVIASEKRPGRVNFNTGKQVSLTSAPADSSGLMKEAAGIPSKKVYAWLTRDASISKGIVSFDLDNPKNVTSVFTLPNSAYAGCYADGKYYFDRYKTTSDSWEHIAFSSVDLATGKITDIKNWSDEYFVVNDMTYDYSTGTIYAMVSNMYVDDFLPGFYFEYSGIWKINPNTGVASEIKQFIDWANGTLGNVTYYTLACDMNGTLYSIDSSGYLVKFDKDNDFAEIMIGSTGIKDLNHTTQSMEFDHSTGSIYWCADHSKSVSELVLVDPVTAHSTVIGPTGNDSHLIGLYIPFEVPSQAAPAAVGEYSAVPDASGANKITLSWVNPTKSFGGYNLASISSVKILRNNEEVATLSSATPGEKMSWEDTSLTEAGNYTYTVLAVNSAGNGMPSGLTRWVGYDVPAGVEKLGIGMTDNGGAILEWEAPVQGLHGGVIDTSTLGYKIIRFPDGTIIANDHRETTYTDNTVPGIGRYYYTVESHTSAGAGEAKNTVEIAIGSGIENYPWSTLFADLSEFNLWTVVNNNGGSTWKWKSRTAGGYQAQAMYEYDNNNDGDDYLISPDLYMKKGARYKVRFAYAGSNEYHTEKMEFTFGQGKTAEAQSNVLASYTMKDGTFRFAEVDLPEIEETGTYNFAYHAISDKGQFNIYVTDVTVSMTVAPPDDDPKEDDDYIFTAPENLVANVDGNTVTLTWNEASDKPDPTEPVTGNIFEDFESMPQFSINPEGRFGWTYIDGDKGITYADDYGYNYPNDAAQKAAMVMAPYATNSKYIYEPNPPYSGDQYLLFESNFYDANHNRPAPAPDDWFISPKLNFDNDFIFRFYCKADPDAENDFGDPWNTEYFRVGYSLTGNNPEDFLWMTDQNEKVTTRFNEWTKKEYSMPKDAKYVCIHYCTPSEGYWFMVDDVFIGIEGQPSAKPAKAAPIFYHYEVLIDDETVATTQECSHVVEGLEAGTHVAKVKAVYKQGESETISVPFTILTSGVGEIAPGFRIYPNPASDIVYFGETISKVQLINYAGFILRSVTNADSMNIDGIAPGIYLLRMTDVNGNNKVERLIVK